MSARLMPFYFIWLEEIQRLVYTRCCIDEMKKLIPRPWEKSSNFTGNLVST